jgi:23S rRNA (adenine2503-C2)-methyltransferase
MRPITDLTRSEVKNYLAGLKEPAYRATQIMEWLYSRQVRSFDEMTNLPAELRKRLAEDFTIDRPGLAGEIASERDGAAKQAWELADGETVETVFLPHPRGATLCISSQVGCSMKCLFCATASMGFRRNLSGGEMVGQVLASIELWSSRSLAGTPPEEGRPFSNLVFMGMGEPLANYPNLMRAVEILNKEVGIGARKITVSTSGLPDKIMKLAREPYELKLAISLNSPFDSVRRKLMPVAGRTSLARLINAARVYHASRNKILTFEYVLMERVNDRTRDAHALATLLRDLPAKLNLIALNPFPGCPYERPDEGRLRRFIAILKQRGRQVTLRKSLGCDILAGCGQLGLRRIRKGG